MSHPTRIHDDLLQQIETIAASRALPRVRSFELAPVHSSGSKCNNFAALILEDGTVGITYVALDDAAEGLRRALPDLAIAGGSPADLARLFGEPAGWQRSLGLAAINAISQVVLSRHPALEAMSHTLPTLDLQASDRLGMVGYFARLVEPIRALRIPLTVIERDPRFVMHGDTVEVTLDTRRLAGCNKVIVTGTTLLNHTLDAVLVACRDAEQIILLGPSASCLPEPLFRRGVTLIGGFQVTSAERFMTLWSTSDRWRDAGLRYALSRSRFLAHADGSHVAN